MKEYLVKMIMRLLPKEMPKPLGRWNNHYCDVKTNYKIDMSNQDHCGPCGEYALSKDQPTTNTDKQNNNKKKHDSS
jgi:hypothetical protein